MDRISPKVAVINLSTQAGLTALNEQILEMMLATFIYPLLLQPLLVYYQRLPSTAGEAPPLHDPFSTCADRMTVDFNQVGRAPPEVTAPAKTALFTLASVFHLMTNRPLLRLLFTALFHSLSPDSTGETVVSAEGCVTTVNDNGTTAIRVDKETARSCSERETYPFGGNANEKASPFIGRNAEERCVFVLAPSLSSLLEAGLAPVVNTRPNPYRRALFQFLEVPYHWSDFRRLTIGTVDAALSLFDGQFVAETLLGQDSTHGTGDVTLLNEVVAPLCASLLNGRPGRSSKGFCCIGSVMKIGLDVKLP